MANLTRRRARLVRVGTRTLACVVAATCALLTLGIVQADAATYTYFDNNSCCSNRHASPYDYYMTGNQAVNANNNQTVCVQEHVYPASGSPFFDNYACGAGYAFHSLNGLSDDQAYCWVNSGTVLLGCTLSH